VHFEDSGAHGEGSNSRAANANTRRTESHSHVGDDDGQSEEFGSSLEGDDADDEESGSHLEADDADDEESASHLEGDDTDDEESGSHLKGDDTDDEESVSHLEGHDTHDEKSDSALEGSDADHDAAASKRATPAARTAEFHSRRHAPAPRRGVSHGADAEGERLQKVLSRAGLASRREAEDWIRAGRITINGQPAVLGSRVSHSDQIRLDSRLIRQRETGGGATAFVVHRSPGESLTQPNPGTQLEGADGSTAPSSTATPMIERLPTRAGRRFITVSPMPRVDGGLELVTSDGELGVRLQRSVRNLVSQFSVRVLGELSPEQLENIMGGTLDSGETIEVVSCEPSGGEGANRWYTLVARGASGKEVRQLFERQGALLSRVQRTHLGPITMERGLGRGQFRELTPEELQGLLAPPADD
jgi:23S rRNA pseudouridine2605 synthase